MKGRNHALMAGAIAVILDLSPAEIAYCVLGASLPDQLEKIGKTRIIGHRTWTHELLLWLLPLLAAGLLPGRVFDLPASIPFPGFSDQGLSLARFGVLFLPGVLHLAGDMMTPRGIRIAGCKVSLGLFKTGSLMEYFVAALFVGLAILYKGGGVPFRGG